MGYMHGIMGERESGERVYGLCECIDSYFIQIQRMVKINALGVQYIDSP